MSCPDPEDTPPISDGLQRLFNRFTSAVSELVHSTSDTIGHPMFAAPATMYQYTTIAGLRGMITGNSVWSTSASYLNDASEYLHGLTRFRTEVEALEEIPGHDPWPAVRQLLLDDLASAGAHDVFVTCFTPNGDQLSQWRAYASDRYGYAVGFDGSRFTGIVPTPMVLNVMYDDELQRRFCGELIRRGMVAVVGILTAAGFEPDPEFIAPLLSFAIRVTIPGFKHSGFAEENECRMFIITPYDDDAKAGVVYSERDGLLVPHIPHCWDAGKLPIREIVIGPNLNFARAERSLRDFLGQHKYEDVEIKRSSVPYLA